MENFKAIVWAKDNLVKNLQVLDHIISDRCACVTTTGLLLLWETDAQILRDISNFLHF